MYAGKKVIVDFDDTSLQGEMLVDPSMNPSGIGVIETKDGQHAIIRNFNFILILASNEDKEGEDKS